MRHDSRAVVIAGGGTGGHLYPGIAVARELLARRPDAQITFAGTARGIGAGVIPREGCSSTDSQRRHQGQIAGGPRFAAHRFCRLASSTPGGSVSRRADPISSLASAVTARGRLCSSLATARVPTYGARAERGTGLTNRLLARFVGAAAVTFESTISVFRRERIRQRQPGPAGVFREAGSSYGVGRR